MKQINEINTKIIGFTSNTSMTVNADCKAVEQSLLTNNISQHIGACRECGNPFKMKTKRHIFCCIECKLSYTYKNPVTKVCPICRKTIIRLRSKRCMKCQCSHKWSSLSRLRCHYNYFKRHRLKNAKKN